MNRVVLILLHLFLLNHTLIAQETADNPSPDVLSPDTLEQVESPEQVDTPERVETLEQVDTLEQVESLDSSAIAPEDLQPEQPVNLSPDPLEPSASPSTEA